MAEIFGDTPAGILLLDVILLVMGGILTPILWGIYKNQDKGNARMAECITSLTRANNKLSEVLHEINEARVRDTELKGHMKGLDNKIENLDRKLDSHIEKK